MRPRHTYLCAAFVALIVATEAAGQSYYVSPYYVQPYYPPVYQSSFYVSPYGYNAASVMVYPQYYGPTVVYRAGAYVRPFYVGPVHSVYYDPFPGTYRYGPGYGSYSFYRGYSPYYRFRW